MDRKVKVYNKSSGEFISGEFKELKKDDIFKLFEGDGDLEIVKDTYGNTIFIARNDAYIKNGIYECKIDAVTAEDVLEMYKGE